MKSCRQKELSFLFAALVAGMSFAGEYDPPADVELVDLTTPTSGSVVGDSRPYSGYPAKNAFDGGTSGNDTRWLAYKPTDAESTFITYKFNSATIVNAYRIWGGNGSRDYKDWTFQGSNDGTKWEILDTRTGQVSWNRNSSSVRFYQFKNKVPYLYYKFDCTANNGDSLVQTYEMEFYCVSSLALGECSAVHGDGATFSVSAALAKGTATKILATATKDGESAPCFVQTIGENIAEGTTVTGALSGFTEGKTYIFGIFAENDEEATESRLGVFYAGTLAIGKIQDADELTTRPAIVRVSRAAADPYDLSIDYAVTSAKATAGVDYVIPSGTVTIKAGEISADVELVPIFNALLDEDATVTFAFATKDATFAVADQLQEVTIVNSAYDITKRYVDATVAGGGQHEGTDWEDAYSSIVDAVNAVNLANIPATIYVKPGTYETTAQLELNGAIRIVGSTGDPADVTINNKTKYSKQADSANNRVIKMNDAGAGVYNVTIADAGCSAHGASVYIGANGGTVSNCVMGATENSYYCNVSAVYLGGPNALVTHCVVRDVKKTNNDVFWDLTQYGLGIHIDKGLVENCLVRNVKGTSLTGANQNGNTDYSATNSVGGVYLAGAGAEIRNCTIVDCAATKSGGIYAQRGAVVKNCAIAGCCHYKLYAKEKDEAIDPWCGDASAFVNCATDGDEPINASCVIGTTNTFFAAYSDGDLVPKVAGPLHNTGVTPTGWAQGDGRLDLAGAVRFVGKAVDIGAYEQQKVPGLMMIVR